MEKQKKFKLISTVVWLALIVVLAVLLITAHLYREKSEEHAEATGQVESLSSDVMDLEAEIEELIRQIEALEGEVSDVQSEYTELQDEHSDLQDKHSDLQNEYTELHTDYKELIADMGGIAEELSAKETELTEAVMDLENKNRRITSLEKRLTRQISRYDDAVTEMEELAGEITELEESIAQLEADIYRLRTAAAVQSLNAKTESKQETPVQEPLPEPAPVPQPEPEPVTAPLPAPEPEVPAYIPSGEASEEELMRLLQYGVPLKWYRNAAGSLYQAPSQFTAFGYYDLTTGKTITYNADTVYYSASLIKAPYIYSVLLEVSEFEKTAERDAEGNIVYREGEEKYNLDEMWTFDPATMMEEGSGEIQAMPAGTQMTWKELFAYVLLWSDNVALNQIMDRFGFSTFYSLVGQLGIQGTSSDFMDLSVNDCLKFMKEIYKFFGTDNHWAAFMKEKMMQSKHKVMICAAFPAGTVPHKYGWDIDSYHDMAIIYDEHPYLLVIMTDLHDGTDEDNAFVRSVVEMTKQIHADYHG